MPGCYRHTSHKKQTVKLGHDTYQLRQIRSHKFCAADQLSVGAGWAGMGLLPSLHLVPSQFPVRNAVESGEDIHSDTRGQDRSRVSAGDIEWRERWSHPPLSHALQRFGSTSTLSNTVRGRNNGVCFPSINSSKKFCQDMFHFTLRAWLSLQREVCVK